MKRNLKIMLLSIWLTNALIAMQQEHQEAAPARSTPSTQSQSSPSEAATAPETSALPESESSSEMLTFYWENKQGERESIGQVPAQAAKAISPVYKAQLEGAFAEDQYSVVLSAEHVRAYLKTN